jgi:valyl-tRNA synthetase
MLMALGEPLPKKVFGHPWLLFGSDKMSKSKGNVIYADDLVRHFGVDAVRYYVQELDIATADPAYRYAYLIFGQAENGTFFELKISNLEKQADLDWLTTFRLVDRT